MIDEIKKALEKYNGNFKENKGVCEFNAVIAERKAFLSTKKLTYRAKFRIVDENKLVKFTEMLIETGSGLSSGGGFDGGMSPGFGFKATTYKTGFGQPLSGNIEEQSSLFGKKFDYKFNYKEIRSLIEKVAQKNGYQLKYQLTSLGL